MPTGTHPHIARDLEIEMAQALGRDEAAIGRTAGEMGAPRAEQDPLDRRVDAIRADKRVDEDRLPVLEVGLDGVAVIDEPHQPVPDVNALRWQAPEARWSAGRRGASGTAGEPEGVDNRVCERGTQERAAVVPTALM